MLGNMSQRRTSSENSSTAQSATPKALPSDVAMGSKLSGHVVADGADRPPDAVDHRRRLQPQ